MAAEKHEPDWGARMLHDRREHLGQDDACGPPTRQKDRAPRARPAASIHPTVTM